MRRTTSLVLTWTMLAALIAADASAQGVQTGTLRGLVTDQQDLAIPGVSVTVRSAALQGTRNTMTEADGTYRFVTLPPGEYVVNFEIAGFATVERSALVPLGASVDLDVTVRPSGIAEAVQVVARVSDVDAGRVGLNLLERSVDRLPIGRNPSAIASLSPGVTENAPNREEGQVVISGAFAFDNLFMLNGVDFNDNVFGFPRTLFIEDAIAETQVLSSGLTAEYGRFSGGVVNAITRNGGNRFSGSYRINVSNPAWTDETPFERDNSVVREGDVNLSHEMTLGGPIRQDTAWFFLAGRVADSTTSGVFDQTAQPFLQKDEDRRLEAKLTATPFPLHTFSVGYFNNQTEVNDRPSFAFSIDRATTFSPRIPNWYAFGNYRGIVADNWLAEAQFSERRLTFEDRGGRDADLVNSPIFTWSCFACYHYNAPFFDANDTEQRNNRQLTSKLTSFFEGAGRHEVKAGYEFYRSHLDWSGNQSPTDYAFYADYAANPDGSPVFDEDGLLIPVFDPFVAEFDHYITAPGAVLDIDTHSFFVQNRWSISRYVAANLGLRYEYVRSVSRDDVAGRIPGVGASTLMPRLAISLDPSGQGDLVLHSSYGHYSGRYIEPQLNGNNGAGRPIILYGSYVGPSGQGRDFAPGFDPANYAVYFGSFRGTLGDDLSSPVTREFTVAAEKRLGSSTSLQATYVHRNTSNLIESFIERSNGSTVQIVNGTEVGEFTNIVYRNSEDAERQYQALVFEGRHDISQNWSAQGAWTVQIKNHGNLEDEVPNSPGAFGAIGNFPEAFVAERHFPTGRLHSFQRHHVRAWTTYTFTGDRWGDLALSGLLRMESPRVYSFRSTISGISPEQASRLEGYPEVSNPFYFGLFYPQEVFFGERGEAEFKGFGALDLAARYSLPLWRSAQPWIKFEVFNLLNNQEQIAWDTTVFPDFESEADGLGLPTSYVEGPFFGEGTSTTHYVAPREFRMSFGFRF